jgi:signal transduction histidine kinase
MNREELQEHVLPNFESFINVRESYITALEKAIDVLRRDNKKHIDKNRAIVNTIDELVAMQQLSNVISITKEPEAIVDTLVSLTKKVVNVIDANIFLFEKDMKKLEPLKKDDASRLHKETLYQYESGIIDWVISEQRTIIVPDLEYMMSGVSQHSYIIVPLIIQSHPIGIYIISTNKSREEFSNYHIQLLTVLATQAAVGVANWQVRQELKKANDAIRKSQTQMFQTVKLAAIGEVAAGILHEIKNPLQIMVMHLDMVRRGRPIKNWNELVMQQIYRLDVITNRLMTFSRSGSEKMNLTKTSVNKAIEEIIALVAYDFERDKIKLEVLLSEHIHPVVADVNFLQQVFLNLLINARDAMPNGGMITVKTYMEKDWVVIACTDTGVGINEHHLENIFKPFYTTKKEGKGTGLGLSTSKKFITQFGGKIKVKSKIGQGTTFTILLPSESLKKCEESLS